MENDIKALNEIYDTVYMLGVDKALGREVRIESCAKWNGDTIHTEFYTQALSDQMTAHQIKHQISDAPTRYLCSAAYYHMLCKNRNTVFIHIPSVKGMGKDFMAQLIAFFTDIAR